MSGKTVRVSIWGAGILLGVVAGAVYWIQSRRLPPTPTIAFVPQTAGAMLWEVGHHGASVAAAKLKCHLYWNAPTTETDVAGQVSLIDKVGRGKYQGLVLAPNHPLAVLTPLRRTLAAGVPVVIVSAPLDLPASNQLGYLVNDDQRMGELAAEELARLIKGEGPIVLAGLSRYAPGVVTRARAAEHLLAARYPRIRVVDRLAGAYDTSLVEEWTLGALDAHPDVKAILTFTATSTRGAHAALKSRSLQSSIRLVGCEQDADLIGYVGTGEVAAVSAENTYRMGYEAVQLISASWTGQPIPARSVVPPLLITKQNVNSPEVNLLISYPR
jgi:ribose transport system substrate-binding protein